MSDGYLKSDENEKIMYIDAIDFYGWTVSELLPYDESKFDRNVKLEDIINSPDDSDIRYLAEVALKNSDKKEEKTENFT